MYYQKTASSKNHNLTLFTKGASLIIIYTVRRSLEHTQVLIRFDQPRMVGCHKSLLYSIKNAFMLT